ncbi:MAG: hypothetical protein U0704_07750 [Candidatus Eisenbacteria bacterium]
MTHGRLAACALVLLVSCAGQAWSEDSHSISEPMSVAKRDTSVAPGARRAVAFTPAPLSRCDHWIVMESAVAQVNVEANDWLDDHLVRNSFGLMRNVSANRSVGGSLDLWWLQGTVAAAPTVRARQWFGRRQSVEASAGWVLNQRDGAVGPIGSVRYSPLPAAFVEGGVCRVRVQRYDWTVGSGFGFASTETTCGFAGIGLSGAGGAVVWIAEAGAILVIGAMLAGMD